MEGSHATSNPAISNVKRRKTGLKLRVSIVVHVALQQHAFVIFLSTYKIVLGLKSRGIIKLVQDGYRMTQPKNCPNTWYALMIKCWNKEPEIRPSFKYIHVSIR